MNIEKPIENTIPCKISNAMFSSERGVYVKLANGEKVSALLDKEQVEEHEELREGGEVTGRVKVYIVKTGDKTTVVDLPPSGFGAGRRIEVPTHYLEE
jgi:hypothetical protein